MTLTLRNMLLFAGVAFWLAGCSDAGSTPPPQTQQIGGQAKKQVLDFVAAAKKTPKKAPENLAMLNELLEAYASEYGKEFEPVKEEGRKLQELYKKKASQAEIQAQLLKFADAAKALPGSAS